VGLFPPPEGTNIDDTVWATIDKAFAEPVIRVEDRADYAATQIIAELLKINGFHGIAYQSQFDPEGFNIALFDLDDAQQRECHLWRVTEVETKFDGPWDGYFSKL
jgi:RES domain